MATKIKGKVVFKDCGDPKAVTAEGAPNEMLLGTIIGRATGTKIAKGADGVTEFKGLRGDFEAIPADPKKDTIRSGVCFLGDAFQSAIVAQLEPTDENTEPAKAVEFAFQIYAVKAHNPQGYSWAVKPLQEAAESDPLQEMRRLATGNARGATAALEAPKGGKKK